VTPSITPSPIITNVYCFEGVYEFEDPAHPFGGVVNYIDQYGNFQTQQYIWLGDFVTIVAQSIISITGVVTVVCPTPTATPVTPTPTPTPSVTPPVGDKELKIFVRDVAITQVNVTLFYSVNYGSNINIPGATAVILPITCSEIYTIPSLSAGDVITIGSSLGCAMEGTIGSLSCPSITSFNINYTYTMDAPSTQAISLTVDTSIIP
jgi:hypothetical protein